MIICLKLSFHCSDFMAVSMSRRLCPQQSGRRILQHFIAGPGGANFNYRLLHYCVYLQQLLPILFCIMIDIHIHVDDS